MATISPDLLHPALRVLSARELTFRSHWLLKLAFANDDTRIDWYGNLVREDGGLGMYATRPLAEAWPNKAGTPGVVVGPK